MSDTIDDLEADYGRLCCIDCKKHWDDCVCEDE